MRHRRTKSGALALIFSIFLGLMLGTFVGIGVWTFYPQPEYGQDTELMREIRVLEAEREGLWRATDKSPDQKPTPSQEARIVAIDEEISRLYQQTEVPQEDWRRNTSIILIIFATVAMAISLTQADRLRVISNGLLLGGIFTMLYGIGWAIASGNTYTRFGVISVALVITIVLGYMRFVRAKKEGAELDLAALAAASGPDGEVVGRIIGLEQRFEAMADALGEGRQ